MTASADSTRKAVTGDQAGESADASPHPPREPRRMSDNTERVVTS